MKVKLPNEADIQEGNPQDAGVAKEQPDNRLLWRLVQAKVAAPRERPLLCRETCVRLFLTLEEAPRHTKRTEGRAEQHHRRAAVRNLTAFAAKERPPRKAVVLSS